MASNNGKIEIEFTRRTVLNDAKATALRGKMFFYKDLAKALGEHEEVVSSALVDYSNICAQAVKVQGVELAQPQDSVEEVERKFKAYLELNPKYPAKWKREIEKLDETWNDPALLPNAGETVSGEV